MALTKAQLRSRVREDCGDEERMIGTSNGGDATTLTDTTRLTQADDYWNGMRLFIIETTDGLAPKGESRRISDFINSTKTLYVELPFSAPVGNGDTYGIATFSNERIDRVIQDTLNDFSEYKPHRFTENMQVTPGNKRFSPPSANSILHVERIEYFSSADQQHLKYENWIWDEILRQVEFDHFWSEQKTLAIFAAKRHLLPSGENDAVTFEDIHEQKVVRWGAANVLNGMSQQEFTDDFGQLKPVKWTTGDVSEEYGMTFEKLQTVTEKAIEEIKESFKSTLQINIPNLSTRAGGVPVFDTHADPDGRPMPSIFWTRL